MMRTEGGIKGCLLLGLACLSCTDKAEVDYQECLRSEARGDAEGAATACEAAVAKDPNSKSGVAAAAKRTALTPAVAKARQEKAEAKAKEEERARLARDAELAAEEAACAKWKTICTLGVWPDGSEKTTGAQVTDTRSACEDIRRGAGLRCDPCTCYRRR